MRVLLVTGMSGGGKTVATRYLEDLGAFCVDNLPPMMMVKFMEACESSSLQCKFVAFAVDVRSGEFFDAHAVATLITEARHISYQIETLFLEAGDDVLLSRYKETRRDHPLASDTVSLVDAIAEEREMLQPLREMADYVIDTSTLRPKALQKKLNAILSDEGESVQLHIEVMSSASSGACPARRTWCGTCASCPTPSISRAWAVTPAWTRTCGTLSWSIR